MFRIGEFAKLNMVTVKTLRYYDKLGLLNPENVDDFTGYRYYSADQMPRLNRIVFLKDMGFTLSEIVSIIDNNLDSSEIKELITKKQEEVRSNIQMEQIKLKRIESFIKAYSGEEFHMKYDIVVKKVQPVKVGALRDMIPTFSEQGHLWEELVDYLNNNGVKITEPCIVRYHGWDENEENVDAEVIETIEGDAPSTDRIKIGYLEGAEKMATTIHKGPFSKLYLANNAVAKWIEENGYKIAGTPRELYIKGEWNSNSEDEYITEIQFPIE